MTRALFISFLAVFVFSTGCSRESSVAQTSTVNGNGKAWEGKDLLAGPGGILKGAVAIPLCPLRLSAQTIESIGGSDPTDQQIFNVLVMPVKAVIDGVFTGGAYIVGGAVDTVTGGALGVIENAEGVEQPASTVHCLIAGKSVE